MPQFSHVFISSRICLILLTMWLIYNMYKLLIALNIILQFVTSLLSNGLSPTTIPARILGNRCSLLPATNVNCFSKLIKDKCYVDKTQYLSKFIIRQRETSSHSFFLSRPRRFGKSILVDTISEFFQGNKQLFEETYIGKHHPPLIRYPVIRLDFSTGLSIDNVVEFKNDLKHKLEKVALSFEINLKAPSPISAIEDLIDKLKDNKTLPVVVLIDEYDSPYIHAYVDNKSEAQKILGVLHRFFSTLKANTNIHLSFMTGVTRLAMDNFFSGPNAVTDLTMDLNYPAIVGFTEKELHEYFGGFIKNVATIQQKEEIAILKEMKEHHDGFQFSSADVQVYSPCSVITYLNSNGTKTTGWSETGGSGSFLYEKLKELKEVAVEYLVKNQIKDGSAGQVTATVHSLAGKVDYTRNDQRSLTALLFHSGYLSIESCRGELCSLRFSNKELLDDYTELISYVVHKDNKDQKWVAGLKSMKEDLTAGQWEDFIIKLGSYYANIPYFLSMYQKTGREAWFQLILNMALYYAGLDHEPVMEDISNKGQADVLFTDYNTTFIFETKYYDNMENALDQCNDNYVLKHIFLSQRSVVCLGLQFSKKRDIMRWGVATYSEKGKLKNQYGPQEKSKRYYLGEKCEPVKPAAQFSPEEVEKITKHIQSYKEKNQSSSIEPKHVIQFLEQMSTTKKKADLAGRITSDVVILYLILEEIKPLLSHTFKGKITSFLKTVHTP